MYFHSQIQASFKKASSKPKKVSKILKKGLTVSHGCFIMNSSINEISETNEKIGKTMTTSINNGLSSEMFAINLLVIEFYNKMKTFILLENSKADLIIKEYDTKGNLVYTKNSKGFEQWMQYDIKGNFINYRDSAGFEEVYCYDEKGNLIHTKNSYKFVEWKNYDDDRNLKFYRNSNGFEKRY